jgi:hypothetical protein
VPDEAEGDAAERPTETAGAPDAEPEPATSETAEPASTDGADTEASGPSAQPEAPTQEDEAPADTPDVHDGHADPGETYLFHGDGATADGRRITYRDGVRFSTTAEPDKFKTYARHAPEPAGEEGDALPPEVKAAIATFGTTVEAAKSFEDVKRAMVMLREGGWWVQIPEADQNGLRRDVWETMVDNFFPGDLPSHATDVSAWRLWVEAQDDTDLIEQSISVLEDSASFKGQSEAMKEALRAAGYGRINLLQTGE